MSDNVITLAPGAQLEIQNPDGSIQIVNVADITDPQLLADMEALAAASQYVRVNGSIIKKIV